MANIFNKIYNHLFVFNRTKLIKIIIDSIIVLFSFSSSYLIRFGFSIRDIYVDQYILIAPITIILTISVFMVRHVYQRRWRFSSISDIIHTFNSILAAWILVLIITSTNLFNFPSIPHSISAMFLMINIICLGSIRLFPGLFLKTIKTYFSDQKNILIIGAGACGDMIIRQMKNDSKIPYHPVAILDDAKDKWNTKLRGVKVYGDLSKLNQIVEEKNVDEIIICTPSARPAEMQRIVKACEVSGVDFKTIPGPRELIDGSVSLSQIRKVKVVDLLDRQPVQIEFNEIKSYLANKVVLVTGAGGSIGSELVRQLVNLNPSKLICLDRTENNLYLLKNEHQDKKNIIFSLADILNDEKLEYIFQQYKPEVVFHAAAYKHVPLMDEHPEEAVRNNVFGTYNMVALSDKFNVEKFILISTDKAVNPSSVMGATKRLAELLLQSYSIYTKTKLLTVRFGNVLNSQGSVVPLFQSQIEKGGPVTITHPDMKRFFMTIPEAVKLILQSARMGEGNEIFVLDMGEPIKLIDIANRMIKLSGYEPNKDIAIKFIGSRIGEKLEEQLWNTGEVPLKTIHPKISMAMGSHFNNWDIMQEKLAKLDIYAKTNQTDNIIMQLIDMVSEYKPLNRPVIAVLEE